MGQPGATAGSGYDDDDDSTDTSPPRVQAEKRNGEEEGEEEEEEEEKLEETWRRYGDELAAIREMGAQTNELLNIYMSFAMGENPLVKATTIEQQGNH